MELKTARIFVRDILTAKQFYRRNRMTAFNNSMSLLKFR